MNNNNLNNKYVQRNATKKYNKNKQKITIILLFVFLIVLINSIFIWKYFSKKQDNIELSDKNNQEDVDLYDLEPSKPISEVETVIPDDTNNINDDSENDNTQNKQYDYSSPVPESERVELNYFKDAVFIGDSRTEGFILSNGLFSKTTSYTSKGLMVDTIFTDKVINQNGVKVTIMEALKNTSFSKVYIMLGINETGWIYNSLFINKYSEIIDEIKRINPNSVIYVQSILPVSKVLSNQHSYVKNPKIDEYNSLIKQMAKDKEVYYLNVREAIANQDNVLPEDAATDGIHLNKEYCEKWLEYLKKHIVEER